jgi:hypothetical protein
MAVRDERTDAVENTSYKYAYLMLSYGLLMAVAYRSFVLEQQSWDLLALVLLGGVVTTAFQGAGRVLTRRWGVLSATVVVIAIVLSALLALGW